MQYPINAIIGDRGAGKTCFMTALAEAYHNEGKSIFTNYQLFNIPHKRITLQEMLTLPDYLNNSVVLIDEIHIWADAYDFLGKPARALASFATQLRKRQVTWYYTTQVFTQVPKRIRQQTNYFIMAQAMKKKAMFEIQIIEKTSYTLINKLKFNGAPYFDKYDTNEVISGDYEEEKNEE